MKSDIDKYGTFATLLSVTLRWSNSRESFTVTPSALKLGDVISTYDTYIDGSGDGYYKAVCSRSEYKQSEDAWIIKLDYSETNNKKLAEQFSVEWGSVDITIRRDLQASTVVFRPERNQEPWDVKCEFQSALTAELKKDLVEVLARPAQKRVRDELLKSPRAMCAITRTTHPDALDAAHVFDLRSGGATTKHNMLLLRADIHRLFDRGLITITENGEIDTSRLAGDAFYGNEITTWRTALDPEDFGRVEDALRLRGNPPVHND